MTGGVECNVHRIEFGGGRHSKASMGEREIPPIDCVECYDVMTC